MHIWVSLPYATYLIEIQNDTVVDTPPIARWMIGRGKAEIKQWLANKGAVTIPLRIVYE